MNSDRTLFRIDPTPTLPTRHCRLMARFLGYALSYGNYIIAAIVWTQSDWFIALGSLLLGFIVFGIIRSKLRNDSIPPAQRELSYNDYAIAAWYLSRHYCFGTSSEQSPDELR
jgi:hypothetical protein